MHQFAAGWLRGVTTTSLTTTPGRDRVPNASIPVSFSVSIGVSASHSLLSRWRQQTSSLPTWLEITLSTGQLRTGCCMAARLMRIACLGVLVLHHTQRPTARNMGDGVLNVLCVDWYHSNISTVGIVVPEWVWRFLRCPLLTGRTAWLAINSSTPTISSS